MSGSKKLTRSDATLKNLPREDQDVLYAFRYPTDGTKQLSLEQIREEVPVRWPQFSKPSLSTVSEFYPYYELARRMEAADSMACQVRAQLESDPDVSTDDIDREVQKVFTMEMLKEGNVKGYVAIAKLKLAHKKLEHDKDRLSAASKTKIEAGLDALLAEIQTNPKAMAAFKTIQEEVRK